MTSQHQLTIHSSNPDNPSSGGTYSEFDLVTFTLSAGKGRAILNSSVWVQFQLAVRQSGSRLADNDYIRIDNMAGAHALFQEITTETTNNGNIELLNNYPRFVKMISSASFSPDDFFDTRRYAALQFPDQELGEAIASYPVVTSATAHEPTDPWCCFAPLLCLNRASGPLSWDKSGDVKISFRLARTADCLWGSSYNASNTTYTLSNFKVFFTSCPKAMAPKKIQFFSYVMAEATLASNNCVISTQLPAVCNSLSLSFISSSHKSVGLWNSLACERIPQLSQVAFSLNDVTTGIMSEGIDAEIEALRLYIESLQAVDDGAHSGLSLQKLQQNNSFGVGLNLGKYIDLSKVPVQISIESAISSASPFYLFLFGHCLVTL